MSRRSLGFMGRGGWFLSSSALTSLLGMALVAAGCTAGMGPPPVPDVYAPWADGGLDGGRPDATFDAWLDPSIDAYRPLRPDAGMTDRDCMPEEVCGNGVDDDCTGLVDDGCACEAGTMASCFRGDPMHRGLGVCADGTMACEGTEFGRWTDCMGDVLESPEVCDEAGLDEDCDGVSNEGCECSGDSDLPCGTDVGECVAGVQRCVDGMRTACEGATGPVGETCDGLDEDCDGRIDEGLMRRCGFDTGVCVAGNETCTSGAWGACDAPVVPGTEVCNGMDDDCDGSTDESVTRACGTDVGACVAGVATCTGGSFGACVGETVSTDETCNGADDDCDGSTDEGLVRGCGTDVGECVAGRETCRSGAWSTCEGSVMPATELCDGVRDENCNGAVDEGCTCTTGTTRDCGTDTGRCQIGSQTCDGTGNWGMCVGSIDPRTETCDGTDDDCDGLTDEGCDCITGVTRPCGTDVGECVAGRETCDVMGHWGVCTGSTGPATEICNGRDDNCDGNVDEGDVCPRFPPSVTCPGPLSGVVGTPIAVNGSAIDPDGGPVVITWSTTARPAGSSNNPVPPDDAITSFTPDAAGSFTLRMCAVDDETQSACCTTNVTAVPACTPPAAPTLVTACGTSWDRRPIVEFGALPSGIQYELFLDGSPTPYGTVTTVGQNYFRPAAAIAAGGPPPGNLRSITVRACTTADPTCCATAPAALNVYMVEECTTPIAATSSNVIFSEYVIDGGGGTAQPGESIEITNLSHCPVTLAGTHFEYCNTGCSSNMAYRWIDFGATEVIPPRGVYVAIRDRSSPTCTYPFLGSDDPSVFGLRVSTLPMQAVMASYLASGWFSNSGGSLRLATGSWTGMPGGGTTIDVVSPYTTSAPACSSIGYDAVNYCGDVTAAGNPSSPLSPNQLGRLWHPCDAVEMPVPAACR